MKVLDNITKNEGIRQEVWGGFTIRFVKKGEAWYAVAKDVCGALGIQNTTDALGNMPDPYLDKIEVGVETGKKRN